MNWGESMAEKEKIRELPLLPLRGVLVFPYMVIHLDVGRDKSVAAIEEAMVRDKEIFLAMQKEAHTDEPTDEDIHSVGTVAEVKQLLKLPGGTLRILVEGIKRARISDYMNNGDYLEVRLKNIQMKTLKMLKLRR